jgi:hypothetical protein
VEGGALATSGSAAAWTRGGGPSACRTTPPATATESNPAQNHASARRPGERIGQDGRMFAGPPVGCP